MEWCVRRVVAMIWGRMSGKRGAFSSANRFAAEKGKKMNGYRCLVYLFFPLYWFGITLNAGFFIFFSILG